MDQAAQARAQSPLSDLWPPSLPGNAEVSPGEPLFAISNLTANGVRNCIHQAKFLNRFIVINREHVTDTEGAGD